MKKIKKLMALSLSLMMCFSTTVFAKSVESTTYTDIEKGNINGEPLEVEFTIYNYLGKLTLDFPMLHYNEDETETIFTTEKKTITVARLAPSEQPQVSFKLLKGSNVIKTVDSFPWNFSYDYGLLYRLGEEDTPKTPKGFSPNTFVGTLLGTPELANLYYGRSGVKEVYIDYCTADNKPYCYVRLDYLLLLSPEEEEHFLKTGTLNDWDDFKYPGLKELLTGTSSSNSSSTQPSYTNSNSSSTVATAQKSTTQVLVNDNLLNLDAYLINNNNYFKLRDFAYMVNGSEKQFNVSWDDTKKAISLTSFTAYESQGSELVTTSNTQSINVTSNSATLYKDGEQIDLSSYVINNNTYFKLRDLAKLFNIGIGFDNSTSTVSILTDSDYK